MPGSVLSSPDAAALVELRYRLGIRIDRAGPHAQSLLRLTAAGMLRLDSHSCDDVLGELTDAQQVLGFKADVHLGPDGRRRATAPTWVWDTGRAADLLREYEGRGRPAIDS